MATYYDPTNDYTTLQSKITSASNTLGTPKYQDANYAGQIAQNYLSSMAPTLKATNDQIDQNTYNSQRGLNEYLASTGQNRGGVGINRTIGLQNYGNQQKATAYGNLVSAAMSAAPSLANLGLNEQQMHQNQANTQVSQLSDLVNSRLSNQFAEAGLTGTYNGSPILSSKLNTNQLAAAILASYLENSGNAALPSGVSTWINSMFS